MSKEIRNKIFNLVEGSSGSSWTPQENADNNTVAWYLPETALVTRDSSADVSEIIDKLLSGHDLNQATALKKPKVSLDGFIFYKSRVLNGKAIKTDTFVYQQPETIYLVVKATSWASLGMFFDGFTGDHGFIRQAGGGVSPEIEAGAATSGAKNSQFALNTWGILCVIFNGANSKLIINNGVPITWNCGSSNMDGMNIGSNAVQDGRFANFILAEAIFRSGDDSTGNILAKAHQYLTNKHVTKLANVIDCTWTRQGIVIDGSELVMNHTQEPCVLYTTTDSIIVGNPCFQMWYSQENANTGYAESKDGKNYTKYAGNPILNTYRVEVVKYDGLYYLYTTGAVYTSATPVDFVQQINSGIAKANIHVVKEGALWYQIYEHAGGGGGWLLASAFSNDGINWVTSVDPLIQKEDGMIGGPWFFRADDGYWYMWCHKGNYGGIPTEAAKYRSIDFVNWDIVNWFELERATVDEGVNNNLGQIADLCLVEVNGIVYMYYSAQQIQDPPSGKIKLVISNKSLNDMAKARSNTVIGVI